MVRFIYYQFNYRRREWLGAFPVLFSAGIVVGTCFTILFNVLRNTELFSRVIPTPLFIAPVIFGGLTLFFLISTLIKLLLNIFKDEYRLWYILGADRRQLSMLVGGQFAIVTLISSFIGSFISILSAKGYYYLIQGRVGVDYFPSISIQFSLLAVFLTIIFLTLVCFASATYNAYKLLDENIIFEEDKGEKKIYKFTKFGIFGINVFLWLSLVVGSVVVPYLDLPGGVSYKLSFMSSAIFYLLVIHILFLKYLSPWIELRIVQFLFKKGKGFAIVLSKWSVIEKKYFLSSVTLSMVTAITLVTGLLLISNNGIRNSVEQNKEIYISFLFYLVAPLFIIVSNIISVTIISSRQDETLSFQLETLGVSRLQKIKI
ncbi:TPA: FtsX-like permease family protein, partial [Streptococcus equi subsp. zooepidemicus]|nr:FtsX-like permease family protein [Streptococcus equi subsp. zooepidemicus]